MKHLHVEFGPVDTLNPAAGYQIRITDTTGKVLFAGGKDPVTGTPLRDPVHCSKIVQLYV
jgi:hypothetical protein